MEYISQQLMPDVAVLDARMTMTLPPRVTASTGMDTLCHAIEAYSCLQKNPLSDAYAAKAVELVRENLLHATRFGHWKRSSPCNGERKLFSRGGLFKQYGGC